MVEIYRVTKRVELGIKATAVCSEKLQQLLKDINRVWNNLMGFMSLAKLTVRRSEASRQLLPSHICLCVRGPVPKEVITGRLLPESEVRSRQWLNEIMWNAQLLLCYAKIDAVSGSVW